jgi:large subunit ribosomal protein L25
MAEATITVEPRKVQGKWAVRRLRRQGWIPAILYGAGAPAELIQIHERELEKVVRHQARLVRVEGLGDSPIQALVRDVQWDIIGKRVVHVDFHRVAVGQRVHVKVPVILRGTPAGLEDGGRLDHVLHELEVECLATEIPDEIRVDVSGLKVGDVLHVADLMLPAGVVPLVDRSTVVAVVSRAEGEEAKPAAAEAPAAPKEPEVITRRKEEKEEE